jgi:glycerol-3-phosphate acyltransferase PlsY
MGTIGFVAIAYLIGSVSFAVVVTRLMGAPDPRTFGSKNPGATNVLRSGNKLAAVLTLLGDSLKGWLAVWLAARYGTDYGAGVLAVPWCAVAVVVGHMYPVFHGFRGGKGVSTAAGVLFALNLWLGAGTLATWLIIAFFFRLSSLSALVAAVFAPFAAAILYSPWHATFWSVSIIALLLVWRHRKNIANLIRGTEGRIGEKKTGEGKAV